MRLSVIAPTYNEAENIRPLLEALQATLHSLDYEIVVSDGDSPDRTWEIVEELAGKDGRIRLLRGTNDHGLGAAVVSGFACATGDVLACIDADLQHDPGILPRMLNELEGGADLVVGSRYATGGSVTAWGWRRRFQSRMATWLARRLLGTQLRDPLSGYFMLHRDSFLRVKDRLNGDGFKILLEIVTCMKPQRVCEVPYVFRPRSAGKSKLSTRVAVGYMKQLWRLRRQVKPAPGLHNTAKT